MAVSVAVTPLSVALAVLAVVVASLVYAGTRIGHRSANMPPGPPTRPFLGNIPDIPKEGAHELCRRLRKDYGPIVSLKIMSGNVIVLQSARVVKDLIDKRSAIYSSRPDMWIVQGLIADNDHPLFMPYGKDWQKLRRIMHSYFSAEKCRHEHLYVQNAEAIEVIYDFLHRPDEWYDHGKRFSTSVTTTLLYGIRGPRYSHWAVKGIFEAMDRWGEILELGATPPVDIFPILKWVPRFLAPWKQEAAVLRRLMNGLYGGIWQQCKERYASGERRPCLADQLCEQQESLQLTDHQISFLMGVMLEGGSDTTAGSILSFLLAMIHKPEIQAKAHAELDAAIGEDRSPTWEDFESLPYIRQIQKETLRWRPVLPIGVAHRLEKDDVYNNMHLPAGSTVLINTWGLSMDEEKWGPDVGEFKPERFAEYPLLAAEYANASDPEQRDHHAFGGGRRICPGIHLAERNLFLEMSKLLWAFEFTSPIDPATGAPFPVHVDPFDHARYTKGNVSRPMPFPLGIKVRSAKRAATIDRERAEMVASVFKHFPETPEPAWWASIQPKGH